MLPRDPSLWHVAVDACLRDDKVKFAVVAADARPGVGVDLVANVLQRVTWAKAVDAKQFQQRGGSSRSHLGSSPSSCWAIRSIYMAISIFGRHPLPFVHLDEMLTSLTTRDDKKIVTHLDDPQLGQGGWSVVCVG